MPFHAPGHVGVTIMLRRSPQLLIVRKWIGGEQSDHACRGVGLSPWTGKP